MTLQGYSNKFEYDFGNLYCFENYAVGDLKDNATVDTTTAKAILKDIAEYYAGAKMVYISNREFPHDVDPKVYKLVDYKKMVGIAIVAVGEHQKVQAASEQALYKGSFGFFSTLESAISWSQSFVQTKKAG